MIKKQIRIISICAVAIAALILVWLFVLNPIIEKMGGEDEIDITLLDGETIGITNRIMITPQVNRSDMKNVQVHNKDDSFKVIHHLGNNSYYVEGAELVPVNQEIIASFFTNVGYLLSMSRVAAKDIDDGNEILENLKDFGFNTDNEEEQIYFTVTKTDDTWYKITIGDKIPTTGGYYVMYEDINGVRPAIYILDTMMEETILSTKYSLMDPIVAMTIPQNQILFIDNFRFYQNGDLLVEIYNAPLPEDSAKITDPRMKYPAPYLVSDKYTTLTSAFVYFVGDKVIDALTEDEIIDLFYSEEDDIISEELLNKLLKYGFDKPSASISFNLDEKEFYFLFSSINENGNYYVLSTDFYSIIEISPASLTLEGDLQPFITWDLIRFVDKPIVDQNINDVESVVVKSPGKPDAVFTLEGTGQELIVQANGTVMTTQLFRDYYYSILSIDLLDYETDIYQDKEPMLEMIMTMRDGVVREYKFYFVENQTRRSFYSINGVGDFYVLRDKVLKLINDTELVIQGLPINRDAPE